jgi:ABC-type transport system substrate-binding protein
MIERGGDVDFTNPSDQQLPASGDRPSSLTLVRNPSWDPSTDPLRWAQPDRIVLTPVANEDDALRLVKAGALDFVDNWEPKPDLLAPAAAGNGTGVYPSTQDSILFLDLNTAIPPLDDLHVRRAINFAVARSDIVAIFKRAGIAAVPETHIGLDTEEDDLLLNFDPYKAATGDLAAAKQEMAQSGYDRNHDGVCDAPACHAIPLIVRDDHPERIRACRVIARQLEAVGIQLMVEVQDPETFNSTYAQPKAHVAMRFDGWAKDLTSGSTYFGPLFGSPATGVTSGYGNPLLGAGPATLRKWGYTVTDVPNVDAQIERCLPLTFDAQVRCWAQLDQYLMTEVVPWVPLITQTTGRITSSTVAALTFDQSDSAPMPSLDRVVLRSGTATPVSPAPSFPVPSIPDGVYRTTLTRADLYRFDPHYDPGGVDENTGTVTIYARRGQFELVATADHPIYNPLATGIYRGVGAQVTFEIQQATFNALTLPTERWSFDGHALHFSLLSCRNLDHLDPEAPHLCEDARALFEAHPWEKVA